MTIGVHTEYRSMGSDLTVIYRGQVILTDIPLIVCHGVQDPFSSANLLDDLPARKIPDLLANGGEHGGPFVAYGRLGSGLAFGQDETITAIESMITQMNAVYGTRTDQVALYGGSGGGFTSLNWAWRNPDRVHSIGLVIPGLNLTGIHDENLFGFGGVIESVYGGSNATWLAARPTHDPMLNLSLIQPFGDRIGIFAGEIDTLCHIEDARAFAAATGAFLHELPGIGHDGGDNWDSQIFVDWFLPRMLHWPPR